MPAGVKLTGADIQIDLNVFDEYYGIHIGPIDYRFQLVSIVCVNHIYCLINNIIRGLISYEII